MSPSRRAALLPSRRTRRRRRIATAAVLIGMAATGVVYTLPGVAHAATAGAPPPASSPANTVPGTGAGGAE